MVDIDPRKVLGDLIYSTLTEFIEKELKTTSFEFKLSSATKQGDNFIGIVHRVTYNKIDENIKNQEFTLILKVAPTNLARRESFFSRPTFLREIYSYTKVILKAIKTQKSKVTQKTNKMNFEYRFYRIFGHSKNRKEL